MKNKKMPYSLKKFIRRKKAEIRQKEKDPARQAELIKDFYKSFKL
ncbi:MAG: hypothetical protein WC459_03390 [Patescibacteria group bacterium]